MEENLKKKILIVDDSDLNRALLSDILEQDYDLIEASNGMEAMAILHERGVEISLMLLDIVMPGMDGFEVLAMMNKQGWINTIPVIMISAESGGAYIDRAYDLGAIDYINRPFDERTVKHRVACNYMLALKQKEVEALLSDKIYEKEKDNSLMIEILSNIVEFRNGESGLHVLHVHIITEKILKQLVKKTDKYQLTPKDIRMIATASALHDIGKISIPSEILNKPGKLTDEEYSIMKQHTIDGAKMLNSIPFRQEEELLKISYQICRWHHERYDGKGYPDGLKGDKIPIAAQVVALADVYDALISRRVYKPPITPEKAVKMIKNGECGNFNPLLIECLDEIWHDLVNELDVMSYGELTENGINESVQQLFKSDGTDVSRRMVKQIEHERMKYKHLADISHEITFEYVLSPEMIRLSDWSAESLDIPAIILNPLDNEAWCKIFPRDCFEKFLTAIRATDLYNEVVSQQYRLNTGSGEKWYKVIAKAMWTNDDEQSELEGAICKIVDVSETEMRMNQLERRAECDELTGLFNKEGIKRRVKERLASDDLKNYILLFFDIDDFKQANDKYGHIFGDMVLEEVAKRIKKNTRSSDICARIGGDEFMMFMEYNDKRDALIKRIFNSIIGGFKEFDIKVSMGVASGNKPAELDQLVMMADAAMYTVKQNGKNSYRVYDDSMKNQLKKQSSVYMNVLSERGEN